MEMNWDSQTRINETVNECLHRIDEALVVLGEMVTNLEKRMSDLEVLHK